MGEGAAALGAGDRGSAQLGVAVLADIVAVAADVYFYVSNSFGANNALKVLPQCVLINCGC